LIAYASFHVGVTAKNELLAAVVGLSVTVGETYVNVVAPFGEAAEPALIRISPDVPQHPVILSA
jgi:hypothetical protein